MNHQQQAQSGLPFLPLNELADFGYDQYAGPGAPFRIGLLIPMCGSAGMWAPSCIASAQVAVAEMNKGNGISGRPIELLLIDSAVEAETPVAEVIDSLINVQAIDAIVGMHISAVRQSLARVVRQRIPYVYTPLYEGGERTNGIFAIGDTPERQTGPALAYFCQERKLSRWALVGNDYVWPRASNRYAKKALRDLGASVVHERYLPFGESDMHTVIEELSNSRAEAVLLSLVGQDAITFNRAFGEYSLHRKIVRFSCAIEENGLLASSAENVGELYSAASYFGSLATPANASFKEKYYQLHGERAPVLNAMGQSTYEGIHFLAGLLTSHQQDWTRKNSLACAGVSYRSVRSDTFECSQAAERPIFLAQANGALFEIIKKL